jgi:hypothetical protein
VLRPTFKRQFQLALAINLPLFFLFVAPGEIRALSMLYPGLLIMLGLALNHWLFIQPELSRLDRPRV